MNSSTRIGFRSKLIAMVSNFVFQSLVSLTLLQFLFAVALSNKPFTNEKSDFVFQQSIPSSGSNNTRCGGALTDLVGHLSYKALIRPERNERCVWVIRVENATRYMVNVKRMGFESDPNNIQVILTGIGLERTNITDHFVPSQENSVHFFNKNLVLVTFHTGNSNVSGTGFILEYSALHDPESIITTLSPQSKDYFDTSIHVPASVRHPEAGNYDNSEVSIFVIAPTNNIYKRGQRSEISYTKVSLEGDSCYDALYILEFNSTSVAPTKWENVGRICGDIDNVRFNSPDLLVIVFRTDYYTNEGEGFQLTYESGCLGNDDE